MKNSTILRPLRGFRKRPSDAARWTRCAGALRLTEKYPNESTSAADEGTAAHLILALALETGMDAYDFIGQKVRVNGVQYECDAEMAEHLQPGIDEAREYEGRMIVEQWVDTTEWVGLDENGNRQGGTIDLGIIGQHLYVQRDLKYGRGVPVQAVGNDQQVIYCLAAYETYIKHEAPECKTFMLCIEQPRNSAGGGVWILTLDQLMKEGERIKKAAIAADDPDAPLTPSPYACRWCPAANVPGRPGGCPAHNASMMDDIEIEFDDLDADEPWEPPVVEGMTPERLIRLSENRKAIENWLEFCHAAAIQHLLDNGPAAGRKAVYGRKPPAKWVDTGAAEAFIRQKLKTDDPFTRKLMSPAQVKKSVGKKYELPTTLVERGDPKPIMVPEEDAREAIRPFNDDIEDFGSEFDDLGEDDDILADL